MLWYGKFQNKMHLTYCPFKIGANLLENLFKKCNFITEQLLEEAQNNTAEERYIKMIEENSSILLNTPLKDIASYLGIAPQSLSRIRKNIGQIAGS